MEDSGFARAALCGVALIIAFAFGTLVLNPSFIESSPIPFVGVLAICFGVTFLITCFLSAIFDDPDVPGIKTIIFHMVAVGGWILALILMSFSVGHLLPEPDSYGADEQSIAISKIRYKSETYTLVTEDGDELAFPEDRLVVTRDENTSENTLVVRHARSEFWNCDTYSCELVRGGGHDA